MQSELALLIKSMNVVIVHAEFCSARLQLDIELRDDHAKEGSNRAVSADGNVCRLSVALSANDQPQEMAADRRHRRRDTDIAPDDRQYNCTNTGWNDHHAERRHQRI